MKKITLTDAVNFCRKASAAERDQIVEALKQGAKREALLKIDAFQDGDYAWFEARPQGWGVTRIWVQIESVNVTSVTAKIVRASHPMQGTRYENGRRWKIGANSLHPCTKMDALKDVFAKAKGKVA